MKLISTICSRIFSRACSYVGAIIRDAVILAIVIFLVSMATKSEAATVKKPASPVITSVKIISPASVMIKWSNSPLIEPVIADYSCHLTKL